MLDRIVYLSFCFSCYPHFMFRVCIQSPTVWLTTICTIPCLMPRSAWAMMRKTTQPGTLDNLWVLLSLTQAQNLAFIEWLFFLFVLFQLKRMSLLFSTSVCSHSSPLIIILHRDIEKSKQKQEMKRKGWGKVFLWLVNIKMKNCCRNWICKNDFFSFQ